MYILSFETTGNICSAALIDENSNIIMRTSDERMSHLRELMAMSESIIAEAGISKSEITAVSASAGPGSFTGIRIGVTSARTVAQALGVKCISVSSLEIFRQFADESRRIAVIFNARRGQVYGAVFDHDGKALLAPGPYMLEDVLEVCDKFEDVVFYGDGVDAYRERLEGRDFAPEEERYQTADMVAKEALSKYRLGEVLSYEEFMPDYMRIAEAEQKLKDGTLEKQRAAKLAKFRGTDVRDKN